MSKQKKIFVVSDVHGYYTLLKNALDNAGFDPENPDHLLICCGDYFDRGVENLKVLKYFERLKNKVLLRGNHEEMLLEIFKTEKLGTHNLLNGTVETINEFFGKYAIDPVTHKIDFSGQTRNLDRITDFILETVDYFETEHYIFVHGWLPCEKKKDSYSVIKDWRSATEKQWSNSRWTKWVDAYLNCENMPEKILICGHCPSFYGNSFNKKRKKEDASLFYGNSLIVVDAGTYTSNQVNVLVIEDNLI